MKRTLITTMLALGAGAAGAIDGTNVWTGASAGGDWSDPANWTANSSAGYTAAELLARDCVYDISALADGAELMNNTVNLRIAGLRTAANQGTVTLLGENFYLVGQPVLEFGQNTTVVWKMNHPNNWGAATGDGSGKIVLIGSGTLRLEPTSDITFYGERQIQPCHSMTLVIGSHCYFQLSALVQYNNSTVRLENNVTVAYLFAGHDGCKIDLNGHNIYVGGGEHTVPTLYTYRGTVTGSGNITHFGGWTGYACSTFNYTGWLALYTGNFTFQPSATLAETVRLIADGPGRFIFPASQTLANYSGAGAVGGVQMADGTTLTLTGTAGTSQTVAGRIYGNTDVVKTGAGYEQILTGDNAYTGSTTVAAGTLTLRRPTCRPGLVAHWTFDDADNLGRDFGPNGYTLSMKAVSGGVATQSVAGVEHRPAIDIGPAAAGGGCAYYQRTNLGRTVGFPAGNDPISVSLWIRPHSDNPSAPTYLFRTGDWGGNGTQLVIWQRGASWLECCIVNWSLDDGPNSPIISCPGLSDGNWHHVAVTYADNSLKMYYDGELKAEKTTTCPLNLPNGLNNVTLGSDEVGKRYYGGIDEVCVWNRALAADEVAAEYALSRPAVADPAAVLPEPLCHWAFDDADDVGKDTMGRAALSAHGATAPTAVSLEGCYGHVLNWDGRMKLPAAQFPENFPTGGAPFTVSVRVRPSDNHEYFNLVAWGETPTNCFRLFTGGCPRRMGVTCGTQVDQYFAWSNNTTGDPGAWTHIVVVGDTERQILRLIRDGKLETTLTGFKADIAAQDLLLNCNNGGDICSDHFLDDVRIYDRALTVDEALTLSRALEKGTVGPVIPSNSVVTVAAAATLKVEGEGHSVKTLAGTGDLFLNGPTTFDPGAADGFTGTVRGTGTLVLDGPIAAASVSANVQIAAGAELAGESLPLAATSGTLLVPSSGRVTFAARPAAKRYVVASGAQAVAADGIAGWTCDLNPKAWDTAFAVEDGALVLHVKSHGCTIIIR